ncbi:uncharacterized protein LOC117335769 isoform X2 [Pecten maximus]|uniref:uncharacterized protein LOC117335769 isoform X1 n=1 Tax=Pecten maximus TaxID=6579 RepID=UPI001458BE63|nr:uncharacterized protein LOC117335769 isoform X1 [Pecten maximus]XP_033751841.1 uncharacterized protein LOC117335769 isoform X2 [Pecten maximus]
MYVKLDFVKHKAMLPLEFVAVLFTILGLFLNIWWSSCFPSETHSPETLQNYGLWERVECTNGICQLTDGDSSGFLIFTRFAGILSLFLTICALLSTAVYLWKRNKLLIYITGVFSIFNGCITFLMSMVLVGEFHVISNAWDTVRASVLTTKSQNICYNPVVIFFFIFSGIPSMIVAIVTLMKLDNAPEHKGGNSTKKIQGDIALVS